MKKYVRRLAIMTAAMSGVVPLPAGGQNGAPSVQIPVFAGAKNAPRCDGVQGYSADFGGRRTFLWRPEWVAAVQDQATEDAAIRDRIVDAGDKALSRGPYSVTDKGKVPPGASPNDYTSIGPYWWPDPSKSDGLPYIRRDGEINPERSGPDFDKTRLGDMASDVQALALAYTVTGEQRYADHGAQLLRVWFLDPATRMNPNMNFAQGIPGRVAGRGFGIIDSSSLSTVVEAAGLLRPSGALDTAERAALRAWYRDFVVWLVTSENGTQEMQTTNNHGIFYDFYVAHFALFAGVPSAAISVIDSFPEFRIGVQMDKQGRFLRELKRTRSWHYANFVVIGAAQLATIAECVDRDLWRARLADGRGMETAAAFLAKYSGNPGTWPFEDRDLSAGDLAKMERTARRTQILLERASAAPAWSELP